ncbi:MAG TPA: DUF2497 domain-containing protein [Roseiarcus sp.]|nr:DUF2497 domain-containing protein [Roseiarcus sp.]
MNAANPSFDRDLDALHRAQRAYEPSMEEILASIRNIIADEKSGVGRPHEDPGETPAATPAPAPAAPSPQPVSSIAPEAAPSPPPMPRVVWQQPSVEQTAASAPEAAPAPVEPPEPAAQEEPLVSRETNAAVTHSFDALAVGLMLQNPAMIEEIVRDMIRPMLKTWLDDNLPSMVERLVRAEIQRVARGGR